MARSQLLALHKSLLARDPRAPSKIVEHLLAPMVRYVSTVLPSLTDPQDAEEACLDALLDYFQAPSDYDPGKGALTTYLWSKAYWKARQFASRNARRSVREASVVSHLRHVNQETGGEPATSNDPHDTIFIQQIFEKHLGRIAVNEGDAPVFAMMMRGETREEILLRDVGLEDTPVNREEMRRRCERIRGRLRRLREKL